MTVSLIKLTKEVNQQIKVMKLKKLDDIHNMYSCVEYVDKFDMKGGLQEMANIFQEFIVKEGNILIEQRVKSMEVRKKQAQAMKNKAKLNANCGVSF